MSSESQTEKEIYSKYHLKKVINASGRMTILGVSTPRAEVVDTVSHGLNEYFEIKDLVDKTGQYIAKLLNVENAVVVSCASAGIAQAVAGLIVKDDRDLLFNLHSSDKYVPREIIVPKGHNVNFGAPIGTMVSLGGGLVVEAGYANECKPEHIESLINPDTAAILYVKSHHCVQKSMLSVAQTATIAKKYNIPLIVDAAAEEDLQAYYQQGADLVIYSGAKAIEGPTSGLVIGRHQAIEWLKLQSQGIGRPMKVGKEGILGLTKAIELYINDPKQETGQEMVSKMTPFIEKLNSIDGISAKVVWDGAGRDIARAEISFDSKVIGKTAIEMIELMKQGEVAVYFREYKANEGKVDADVRSVTAEQLDIIYNKIKKIIQGVK
ncbi:MULTISPECIES: DgaE family pyridoxal phosphate-dependent ammonia lyase [unclassified Gilliamella]|uniref:DgaE family pyridoxal phosphate-dependent ammonia lyase n=1 Tax=unclassified Gilliamella TaxID=2685620 RepID=UPI001C6A4B60|nr:MULTISPECIES: DgaE family pyridoxal phosphate-dependent ammonia lyase [unclassified Gilliamella]MCX8586849.1 DgaE family pyridoxal phosphate-dependent ammonia lyase [Gilliamella sp. B3562]MCX8674747.1 DgaE family pyridoxal phosphate-dependent ammonia lyase [Gilliamella sp. B3023]MCX8686498.1 DgaE family pyridoxal phosphate-dependent ammonia lyase [Gilliamella sp. B2864]QYN41330.1 DgaE family pyridoxal phosphate-dependent ammonia lyase [Gilliamella sp. ESL0443]